MATVVIPRSEISVVILATHFKQMRVICDELCHYTGAAQ